ncbi:MAG TPA: hypothetical protein PLD23_19945 [Armatimonadota bacterium]|nr:hypothetical protein [Armatimonadota bacterium]
MLGADEVGHVVDLELGPGVYLDDGRSEADFEADLEAYWSDPYHFGVPTGSPLSATFCLDLMLAGSGAWDIHYDGEVWAQESRTPEPGVAALLAFAGCVRLVARRRRRAD